MVLVSIVKPVLSGIFLCRKGGLNLNLINHQNGSLLETFKPCLKASTMSLSTEAVGRQFHEQKGYLYLFNFFFLGGGGGIYKIYV